VVDEAYLSEKQDFSPQLSLIKERKPDLMIIALYTNQHLVFSKQFLETKIDLPFGIHSVGAGSEDPVFYKEVPQPAVEYMFVQEDWQVDKIEVAGRAKTLNSVFEKEFGYGINAYGAQGYSNVWVIYDALERSGSADKDNIREALAKTNITSGPALVTGYQKISFNEKGQSLEAHGVVSQNQRGKRVTVWPQPNRLKGSRLIWPIPSWNQR
jgi:branched-chain amino acid transport system substrate-binding protein